MTRLSNAQRIYPSRQLQPQPDHRLCKVPLPPTQRRTGELSVRFYKKNLSRPGRDSYLLRQTYNMFSISLQFWADKQSCILLQVSLVDYSSSSLLYIYYKHSDCKKQGHSTAPKIALGIYRNNKRNQNFKTRPLLSTFVTDRHEVKEIRGKRSLVLQFPNASSTSPLR